MINRVASPKVQNQDSQQKQSEKGQAGLAQNLSQDWKVNRKQERQQRNCGDPCHCPQAIEQQEARPRHTGGPGNQGADHSHTGNPSLKKDGFIAMPLKEKFDLAQPLRSN